MRPLLFQLFSLGFLVAGCMTERVPLAAEYAAVPKQSSFLVQKINYDEYGRPLFTARLDRRPGSAGERFTAVYTINDRPTRSYDIAVLDQLKTGPGPLAVVYTWTGRGFEGGVEITSGLFPQGATVTSGPEAAAYLTIKAAPIVIATVTGFVVGVLASIPETAKELRRVIVNTRETVTGFTEYVYDNEGRIRIMKLYPPKERSEPLVKTEFFYDGPGELPVRTNVTSLAEKKVRQVP